MKIPRPAKQDSQSRSVAFASANPAHRHVVLEGLDYRTFEIDRSIQRNEEPGEISKIVRNFNPDALGTFTISVRDVELPDGKIVTKWFLIDGQQRNAALTRMKWDGKVRAVVHYNLSVAEEARLFLDLNDRTSVGPWGRFKARLVAEEPIAVAIKNMLDELDINLGGPNGFSAISCADRIFNKGARGPANLRWSLQVLKNTYGRYDGRVLEALALLFDEYHQFIDTESLQNKMLEVAPSSAKLIGNGHIVQQLYHVTSPMAIAEAIIAAYNRYTKKGEGIRHSSRLPSILDRKRKPNWRDKDALAEAHEDRDAEDQAAEATDREDDELLVGARD